MDDDGELQRARLRDPHAYATVGEWYADYAGFVPIQAAQALSRVMRQRGLTFRAAYDLLCDAGAVVELDEAPRRRPRVR